MERVLVSNYIAKYMLLLLILESSTDALACFQMTVITSGMIRVIFTFPIATLISDCYTVIRAVAFHLQTHLELQY